VAVEGHVHHSGAAASCCGCSARLHACRTAHNVLCQ
jgi:hypothetical protein